MVLFILFVVVYLELRHTMILMHSPSKEDFVAQSSDASKTKQKPPAKGRRISMKFPEVLKDYADANNTVIVTLLDNNYVTMALNFLATSVKKLLGDRKFLMIALDKKTQKQLSLKGYASYYMQERPKLNFTLNRTNADLRTAQTGDFGSENYFAKSNLKTWVVLQILELGYSVLVVDVDTVIFKDPFPYFTCQSCDLHYQRDRVQVNSGFLFVRPTANSKRLYQMSWDLYKQYHISHDQTYLNMALSVMGIQNLTIGTSLLPPRSFMCGVHYYENQNRMFPKPCPACVMVHNNYMGSLPAKVYRFKENLQWNLDTDKYYTSGKRRYLTYENPYFFDDQTWKMEQRALLTGLQIAEALNRTLILPKFHCCDCQKENCPSALAKCSLLSVLRIRNFDKTYANIYRENSFLQHPLVPKDAKIKPQKPILFMTNIVKLKENDYPKNYVVFTPKHPKKGSRLTDVTNWLSKMKDKVLHLHSLYNVLDRNVNLDISKHSDPKVRSAFECTTYEQWDESIKTFI